MSIYLAVWALSLALSFGVWFGLRAWFRRSNEAPVPHKKPLLSARATSVTTRRWVGGGRRVRADTEPFYVCVMWALFLGSIGMLIAGPIHPSTIESMAPGVQRTMAGVLCLGTGSCVLGILSGTRFFRPNADLRECYNLAIVATPANISTLTVYIVAVGNTAHWDVGPFLLGAGGIMAILIAHLWMAWDLFHEIKRLNERVALALRSVASEVDDDQRND